MLKTWEYKWSIIALKQITKILWYIIGNNQNYYVTLYKLEIYTCSGREKLSDKN